MPPRKDRLTRDLRAAEQSVAKAQGELGKVRSKRTETSAERARLQQERARRIADRERTQADLAAQLRSAYMMGRSEPLKMLLNQRSTASFQRNLTYYGYFGRDRASKISLITQNIAEIDELALQIEQQDSELARLEEQRQGRVQELEKARRSRGKVLAGLEVESRNRGAQLKRLKQQQQQLRTCWRSCAVPPRPRRLIPTTPSASCGAGCPGPWPAGWKQAMAKP